MGRAKLNMELIKKEKARKSTYKKRKEGLIKKMHEFTTLCDVDTCMIIFSSENDIVPDQIWPSNNPDTVKRLIDTYTVKRMDVGGSGISYRSYGVADFLQDKNKKMAEELKNLKKKNLENYKLPTWFDFMNDLSQIELRNFADELTVKIEVMKNRRLDLINKENHHKKCTELVQHDFGKILYQNVSFESEYPLRSHQLFSKAIHSGKELEATNQYFNPMVQMPGLKMMRYQNQVIKQNPMMMLLVNDNIPDEYTQFNGGDHEGSSNYNNIQLSSFERQLYYDPSTGMLENMVYNNVNRQCGPKPEMEALLPPPLVAQSSMVMQGFRPQFIHSPEYIDGGDIDHALHGWI